MNDDYGYFGKGIDGYVHYMQSFNDNFGKSGGGKRPPKSGCLMQIVGVIAVVVVTIWFITF
ncbi:hypothetical protein SDC9_152045 [bioreactor metagenome]|uniref:HFLK protein n=1 Tax=bioreactor metagenome TaxID=1076179 RepID=A0A645ESJ4_9ZZZZ|nr:HFLK protein [Lachnospiraceae bacterium]